MNASEPITQSRILRFWAPLATTWLMMSVEGPFLAAVIARLDEPKENLAAYGVAFAVAILIEAPVIMMLSASTALVDGAHAFRKLRSFAYALNGVITTVMVLMLATPIWIFTARRLIGLPDPVAELTQTSLVLLLPWPAAIGYRRFYQGLLIRNDLTRRVAYGTVVRLAGMGVTAVVLASFSDLAGAYVGSAGLSVGVTAEALATRLMCGGIVGRLRAGASAEIHRGEPLGYRRITSFYYPLVLTSVLSLAAHPVVTFFMGRAPHPLESLAVLPVVNSLVFIFRSLGLAYQEVAIAMMARDEGNLPAVARFALRLAVAASLALAIIGFSPLGLVWFRQVAGLTAELTGFAVPPLRILALMPALSVLLSLQRALLVHVRRTRPVTLATVLEVAGIVGVLMVAVRQPDLAGSTSAAVAFMVGRAASNLLLVPPSLRVARSVSPPAA
jgi:hypothetical protein